MPLFSRTRIPAVTAAQIDGQAVPVAVRVSARARAFRLTIPHGRGPVLTVPRQGRWSDAEAFLHRQTDWLKRHLAERPSPVLFADGTTIPLRGRPHRLVGTGKMRGSVTLLEEPEGPVLLVPGAPEHMARRLSDWLKKQALEDLTARTRIHAGRLDVRFGAVTTRAQSSRWGSCSSGGNLSYNWRLILTPPFVLDYVAAHEVAHLVEMNHSPAFWATVARTLPDMEKGRAWLRDNGAAIMAINRAD